MIGVFDSGLGGLTCLRSMRELMPQYDYLYLGDNARAPYGSRSFDVVYEYTLQCVRYLFSRGCPLVIIACNTASAKALRTIQQNDLPRLAPQNRVLGVIRPTVEVVPSMTKTKHIGILATQGTVASESYPLELQKIDSDIYVTQKACKMWVPLIENKEYETEGASYFVKRDIRELFEKDDKIDTIVLGCTHYPILVNQVRKSLRELGKDDVKIVEQGKLVSVSLQDYMHRHQEIDVRCSKNGTLSLETTESAKSFQESASIFLNQSVEASHIELPTTISLV